MAHFGLETRPAPEWLGYPGRGAPMPIEKVLTSTWGQNSGNFATGSIVIQHLLA